MGFKRQVRARFGVLLESIASAESPRSAPEDEKNDRGGRLKMRSRLHIFAKIHAKSCKLSLSSGGHPGRFPRLQEPVLGSQPLQWTRITPPSARVWPAKIFVSTATSPLSEFLPSRAVSAEPFVKQKYSLANIVRTIAPPNQRVELGF